jgi:hypothetical protein
MQNLYLRLAPSLLTIIEFILTGAAGLLILWSQRRKHRSAPLVLQSVERAFGHFARRQNLAVIMVGACVIAVRVALVPVLGIPAPRWNDEFSYLLAADTFAHGRVTNPTHPMWMHFESFHIIWQPTYMSMYPPGQGLALAAGQVLGHPWIGQLLITASMCSALCWMLQAWLPPGWALFGAVLAALRLGILSYWMNTYWCASIAALGGALVLGAWPRLRKHPSAVSAGLLAAGLVILANSRPYEGFIFSIPIAVALLIWILGPGHPPLRFSLTRTVVPIFCVLFVGGVATGYYYYRVTGSPWKMTYQVNRGQYATAPYFIWQSPRPEPQYHHVIMRDYYRWELSEFERNRTAKGYVERGAEKIAGWWQFYLGPLLTVPLLAVPWLVRDRRMKLPFLICATMAAGFAVQTWTLPHYFSPATGALYILLVQSLRHLALWRRPEGAGRAVVRAVPLLACAMIVLRVTAAAMHTRIEPEWPRGNLQRAAVVADLCQRPGRHLVFVRYGDHHDVDWEWVWNEASIDEARIVWARDMGREQNEDLIHYFHDRKAWSLEGDLPEPQLQPYPE